MIISLSFFKTVGFIIIPIATSISTWMGVIVYLYLLNKYNFLLLQNKLFNSIIKIIISSIAMSFVLILLLEKFSNYLDYNYIYKSVYLIFIVGFVGFVYLISCYLLGLLKIKNYKTN